MAYLLSGLVLFFGVHTVPMIPSFRAMVAARVGALPYRSIFSLASIAGFVLILVGTSRAEFVAIFEPPAWSRVIAGLVMPIAFCFLVAAYVPNNFRRVIRHPMLSGVFLWALVHVLANGDLASILLFGSFGAYSVVDILSVNRRSPKPEAARQPLAMDVLVLATGFVAFFVVRHYHAALFGVPV